MKAAPSTKAESVPTVPRRIVREKRTVAAMIAIYCRFHHGRRKALCAECTELLQYAFRRLDRCRFGNAKPTCAQCSIHCYKPQLREKIKQVMRFAGPRMLLYHPILALLHQWDSWRHRRQARAAASREKGSPQQQQAQQGGEGQ